MSTKRIQNYYNIGYGDLKKANYNNLSIDLADNPESMMHLNEFKKKSDTQNALFLVGGLAIVGGFAALISQLSSDNEIGSPEPNTTGSIVSIGLGAGCTWIGYFVGLSKPVHLRRAIENYND